MSVLVAWCASTAGRAVVDLAQVGHRGSLLCVLDFCFIRGLINTLSAWFLRSNRCNSIAVSLYLSYAMGFVFASFNGIVGMGLSIVIVCSPRHLRYSRQ